jgi:hypothetical protein
MQRNTLLSLLLGALVPVIASNANAQSTMELPTIQGTYSISVHKKLTHDTGYYVGCLVTDGTKVPKIRHGSDPACQRAPARGTDHRWNIYKVSSGHVIKSPGGLCLIRGNNGLAAGPSLHLWPLKADKTYCGLTDSRSFRDNGQGYWYLPTREFTREGDLVSYHGGMLMPYLYTQDPATHQFLAVSPSNALVFSKDDSWSFHLNTIVP